MTLLPQRTSQEIRSLARPVADPAILATASEIVTAVRDGGEAALREHAERLSDIDAGAPLVHFYTSHTTSRAASSQIFCSLRASLRS